MCEMGNLGFWVFVGLGLCLAISIVICAVSMCEYVREVRKSSDLLSEDRYLGITLCAFIVVLVLYTLLLVLIIT